MIFYGRRTAVQRRLFEYGLFINGQKNDLHRTKIHLKCARGIFARKPKRLKMDINEYDFLYNDDGELMLVLDGFADKPENPRLTLGDNQATLIRSDKMPTLRLTGVPRDVFETLENVPQIMVCEIDDDGAPAQVYDVPVKKIFNA